MISFLRIALPLLEVKERGVYAIRDEGCKIRIGNKPGGGLKSGINEVSSTVSKPLWRQEGCYDTWNGQPFTT
jgi:hypothetical protein